MFSGHYTNKSISTAWKVWKTQIFLDEEENPGNFSALDKGCRRTRIEGELTWPKKKKQYKSLLPFSKREMLLGVDRYWEFEPGTTKLQQ